MWLPLNPPRSQAACWVERVVGRMLRGLLKVFFLQGRNASAEKAEVHLRGGVPETGIVAGDIYWGSSRQSKKIAGSAMKIYAIFTLIS